MHSPHSLRLALSSLLPWFRSHGKTYPWQVRDPYAVWISEIMLQQTTVSSVVPRYIAWMNQYPSVRELAQASIEEVLRAWEGLGYYSRAKNIHKAARELQKDGFESPPDNKKYLRSLPGIGEYTAAAILSFAYQEPEGVYDANVRRLFARLSADENPGAQRPWRRAYAAFLHEGKPGEINAALMQFGQLVCRSREPSCSLCPLRNYCRAFQEGRVGDFPAKRSKKITQLESIVLGLVSREGIALVQGRQGLFRDLWLLPTLSKEFWPPGASGLEKKVFHHYYTQYHERLSLWLGVDPPSALSSEWLKSTTQIPWSKAEQLPMPSAHRKILDFIRENLTKLVSF